MWITYIFVINRKRGPGFDWIYEEEIVWKEADKIEERFKVWERESQETGELRSIKTHCHVKKSIDRNPLYTHRERERES